ncbi:MAG: TrkH family potassium uptake protein [Clostridia bacterium]|nr:TrkH family potassium uptake protein [Clostridia bacterium]
MNIRMIGYILCFMLRVEAALMVPSMLIGIGSGEIESVKAFAITIVLLLAASSWTLFNKPKNRAIYARDGFVLVGLAWIMMSLFGALPMTLSGAIPNYIDAVFETVSGFTTTGSTILTDVEVLDRSIQFWRSFTHWIGGMGVLVFIMAIIPMSGDRSMHIMRAEVPGPSVDKLVPKARETAMLLYLLYIGITVIEIILLKIGGMPTFDCFIITFGTVGTGGFGITNISVGAYESKYLQWVITIFMMLSGVNFSLYYMLIMRQFSKALFNEELRWYWVIFAVASIVIAVNILPMYKSFEEAIRLGAFQVASIMTTTGFATADFNLWPELSRTILVLLMFVGACAGSTGGGLKVSRIMIMVKSTFREMRRLTHPRSVSLIKLDKKPLDQEVINSVHIYFLAYMLIMALSVLLVSVDGFDFTTTVTSVIACFNNIGPGLEVVGPMGNFSEFSWFSKIVLSLDMLFGRLEIYPMIITMSVSTWKRKKKNNDKNENSLS